MKTEDDIMLNFKTASTSKTIETASTSETHTENAWTDTTTIIPCPNCQIFVRNGVARWKCDDYHPELFQRLEEQD
ncbi:hypothetical protein EI42_04312 [Thermosporothrix hazakensis]|jgi:hypothetical protein|uniref:Uncharacterized protein n=1 Tax=Thermosporothrix hazakensis TaxID=644383 RepID=A0A326U2J1_THEHA|nr:hypothetical protein EI42_04312 [Thermosporothrix hazakensis]GCE50494.1 hypothetical protein KTH_53630 [Thermosporothrix hazakensis]